MAAHIETKSLVLLGARYTTDKIGVAFEYGDFDRNLGWSFLLLVIGDIDLLFALVNFDFGRLDLIFLTRRNVPFLFEIVIALDRKAGEPDPWKAGDRVSVVSKPRTPPPIVQDNAQPKTKKAPLLTKDEGDYVLHLSKDYPSER